jgi:5'-phosphate synthase pdxT subunit
MKVGVLALQGDVPEHRAALERLLPPTAVCTVTTPRELASVDALALPGGESTTIADLLDKNELREPLARAIAKGLPVLATCAGLILLARDLEGPASGRNPAPLGAIDVRVRRNDYGRQRESFEAPVRVVGLPGKPFPGVFIRAPRILAVGEGAQPVAFRGEEIVGVRSKNLVGLTFHPELAEDSRLHAWFLRTTLGWRGA